MKKYFKSKSEAKAALAKRKNKSLACCDGIFKMPKGSRHAGEYAVCTELEYLNTY